MITGSTSIAAFASGVVIPVGIALTGAGLLISVSATLMRKGLSVMNVKQKKHEEIQLLAQTKLGSIYDVISKALTDGHVSDLELE